MSSLRRTEPEERLQVECLLAEYRALYSLAEFRMASLDRRVPLAGAALTGSLASTAALPEQPGFLVLYGIPMALLWVVRTTINHARSFEDAIRRIEQIERELNGIVGREVLSFQSRHPSRGTSVGGRTGSETTGAVHVTALMLLAGCGYMYPVPEGEPMVWTWLYFAYLLLILGGQLHVVTRLRISVPSAERGPMSYTLAQLAFIDTNC